jgi:septal ring factor EnvC (AmiA/AmiB activator)
MAEPKTDVERLAVVEEQIKQMVIAVTGLSSDLRNWQQNYVPRQEISEMFRSRDEDIKELREQIKGTANKSDIDDIKSTLNDMKNDKRSNKAVYAAWAGVAVSALAVIVAVIAII